MSNTAAPFGFRPVRRFDGAEPNYQLVTRKIAYNNPHLIGKGDPVVSLSTGFIDCVAGNTTALFGIFWGCTYYDPVTKQTVWTNSWLAPSLSSNNVVTAYCISDPNMLFEVQVGGSTTLGLTEADIMSNIGYAGEAAPNTFTGFSTAYVNQGSLDPLATLPFKVVSLSPKIGVDNTAAYNTVLVKLNNSEFNTGVLGL